MAACGADRGVQRCSMAPQRRWDGAGISLERVGSPEMYGDAEKYGDAELHGDAGSGEGCSCGKKHCPGVCRDPGHPKKPRFTKPGDRDRGDCPPLRYRMADCQRAGNPHCVARWAKCSVDGKYSSWFAGGGAAFCFGRCRKPTEGTWGLDYDGYFGHVNNWLKYTRGRKQGGEGAYRTDGEPKLVSRTPRAAWAGTLRRHGRDRWSLPENRSRFC